jgi:hypothetical protein
MYKKIIAIICAMVIAITCAACEFSASTVSQILNLDNGDSIKVAFSTNKHSWDMEFKNDVLTLEENDKIVLNGYFYTASSMKSYVAKIKDAIATGSQRVKIEDSGKADNFKYVMISFDKNGKTTYEIVGWIVGSNTGIVADVSGSEELAQDIVEALKFTVKKTKQPDSSYYCDEIDIIKEW